MKPIDRSNGLPGRTRRWLALCIVGGLVIGAGGLLPALLGGETVLPTAAHDTLTLTGSASPAAMLGRLAAGTVLVLALCAGTLPLLRRWLVGGPPERPDGAFEVVASLPLGGRCCVYLVRAGGQHLLAGADAAGLQALVPVGDAAVDGGAAEAPEPPARRVPAGIEPRCVGAA